MIWLLVHIIWTNVPTNNYRNKVMSHSQIHLGSKITPHGISNRRPLRGHEISVSWICQKDTSLSNTFCITISYPCTWSVPWVPSIQMWTLGTLLLFCEDVIIWWWTVLKWFRMIRFMKCLSFIKTVSIDPKFGSKFGSQTSLRLSEFGLLCFFAEWKSLVWK